MDLNKNTTVQKDTSTLGFLLLFALGSLMANVFSSHDLITSCLLGISVLLLVSQLKKMNIKL
jgi:hypothetical protein